MVPVGSSKVQQYEHRNDMRDIKSLISGEDFIDNGGHRDIGGGSSNIKPTGTGPIMISSTKEWV